jgi:hypothetical protein
MPQPLDALATAPEATAIADDLEILRDSLGMQVPYTGGIHAVKPEDLVVYYDVDEEKNARLVLVLPPTFLSPIDLFFAAVLTWETQKKKI